MRIFVIVCLLLASTCSAGGPEFRAPAAPPDKAVLWLFRPATIVGGGNTDHIAVNRKFVASLDIGEYHPVEVDPGPVTVEFRQTAPWLFLALRALQEMGGFEQVLAFEAAPGKNYYIEFSEAELVDADRAASRIGAMRRAEPPDE